MIHLGVIEDTVEGPHSYGIREADIDLVRQHDDPDLLLGDQSHKGSKVRIPTKAATYSNLIPATILS